MDKKEFYGLQIFSLMLCFFVAGSVEMVGIASNYIKVNLHLSDFKANIIPSLVYIWFLVITIPTGRLMNRIGRKNTVILSLSLIAFSMLFPLFSERYDIMIICFILLGISSVALQTSLYPLVNNVVRDENLSGKLTIGQFVKTLASFFAPYIAMVGAKHYFPSFDLGWRLLFIVYFIIAITAIIFITATHIRKEEKEVNNGSFFSCFKLLGKSFVLISFIGVMCHVGIDIGTNTLAPKIIMNRLDIPLVDASFGSSLYFIARLVGCFFWSLFLDKVPRRLFFIISVGLILVSFVALLFVATKPLIYLCIILIGIGNANLFPIIFSQTVLHIPEKKNILSSLMIMAQFGGSIFVLAMGFMFDHIGLNGAIFVLLIGIAYLIFFTFSIRKTQIS